MPKKISDSQFYMWRTIFAVAHADDVVTNGEIRFMVEALEDVPFTEEQRRILTNDIAEPQDIEAMFEKISEPRDQAEFFGYARKLVWADGDFGKAERDILLKLKAIHVKNVDVDDLIGGVKMELEDDERPEGFKEAIFSFRDHFLRNLFRD